MKVISWTLVLAATETLKAAAQSGSTTIGGFSGTHTALPRWCGKPYEPDSPNYNPGGQVNPPSSSHTAGAGLRVQPRYSIYDSSEKTATIIIVDRNAPAYGYGNDHKPNPNPQERVEVFVQSTGQKLGEGMIKPDGSKQLIEVDLSSLRPSLLPYTILLQAWPNDHAGGASHSATTELYYLPAKNSGSTVKIDNLYGGMLVANNVTNYAFEPFLPFGFYTSCSGYLNYSLANVSAYKDYGFNAVNPVCAFTDGDLTYLYDWMDQTNLWYQYDMRGSYLNLTSVAEQIPLIKDRSSFLSWYTADEPDGWQYALNSTKLAYDLLKREDPYHPTGLVLNCHNYYFEEYTSGTDYIMEDAYPIGINPHFSRKFGTVCNMTYGDCGCDDCIGSLFDVSNRLDDFVQYQDWLGLDQKPLWAVLQAFSGEKYWARDPTPKETWAMMILSFNHKAKAMMSWAFPASDKLERAHGKMAKVVTQPSISQFLLGDDPTSIAVAGHSLIDAAYWIQGNQMLVAVANIDNTSSSQPISVVLPRPARKLASHPWGFSSWNIDNHGNLAAGSLAALSTDILILDF